MSVQIINFNVYENRWLIVGAGLAAIVAGVVLVLFRKIGQLQSDLLETKTSLTSAIQNLSSLTARVNTFVTQSQQSEAFCLLEQIKPKRFSTLRARQVENIRLAAIEIVRNPREMAGYLDLAFNWPEEQKSMVLSNGIRVTLESLYRKVIELDPESYIAYNNLGTLLEDKAEQQRLYRLALKFVPNEDSENKARYLNNLVSTLKHGESTSIEEGGPPVSKLEICRMVIESDPECEFKECRPCFIFEQLEKKMFKTLSDQQKEAIRKAAIKIAKDPENYWLGYYALTCNWPEGLEFITLFDGKTQVTKESLSPKAMGWSLEKRAGSNNSVIATRESDDNVKFVFLSMP